MTRYRAVFTATVMFAGLCLILGVLGAMFVADGRVLAVYGVAVLAFATWVSRETYRDCRAARSRSQTVRIPR
jgi:hypothetical protein